MEKVTVTKNFVDSTFESEVLKLVPKKEGRGRKNFRTQILRYGSTIPYNNNIVSSKIPKIFSRFENLIPFDSVTINEYKEGDRIDWHIDKKEAGDKIYIISLLSDAYIEFRKLPKSKIGDQTIEHIKIELPRYSLCIFEGELRYEWEHSLEAKERRISIVFRSSTV